MHTLWVTPYYTPFLGGAQAFQSAMVERLLADGHRVTVLTTSARTAEDFWRPPDGVSPLLEPQEVIGTPSRPEGSGGLRVERLPLFYPWPAPYVFGLLRRAGLWLYLGNVPSRLASPVQKYLARWMPPLHGLSSALARWVPEVDVVQIEDSSWDGLFLAAATAARRYGKPLVACPLMHLGSAWVRSHYQMAHQVEMYRQASAVLALSQREAQAYVALGVSPECVHTIPMGMDDTLAARPEVLDSAGFRREHGLGDRVIAFLGANTYDKGAFALVQSVAQLAFQGLDIDLVLAGAQDAALKGFLERQPANAQEILRDHLHILGAVDEMTKHRLLAACDLLALPSQVDTFGIVFLEAWKHGKPVIGADAGGIPDLVQHEKNGLIVPFGDVPALAAAIRRLLQEPDLASRLGRAGQQIVHGYTWDQTYRTLLEVYDRVLVGTPPLGLRPPGRTASRPDGAGVP